MIEISGEAQRRLQAALSAVWQRHQQDSWEEEHRGKHERTIRTILTEEYPDLDIESKWGEIRDAVEEVWDHAYSVATAIRNIRDILSE
jgi:hypothetical protein